MPALCHPHQFLTHNLPWPGWHREPKTLQAGAAQGSANCKGHAQDRNFWAFCPKVEDTPPGPTRLSENAAALPGGRWSNPTAGRAPVQTPGGLLRLSPTCARTNTGACTCRPHICPRSLLEPLCPSGRALSSGYRPRQKLGWSSQPARGPASAWAESWQARVSLGAPCDGVRVGRPGTPTGA